MKFFKCWSQKGDEGPHTFYDAGRLIFRSERDKKISTLHRGGGESRGT